MCRSVREGAGAHLTYVDRVSGDQREGSKTGSTRVRMLRS